MHPFASSAPGNFSLSSSRATSCTLFPIPPCKLQPLPSTRRLDVIARATPLRSRRVRPPRVHNQSIFAAHAARLALHNVVVVGGAWAPRCRTLFVAVFADGRHFPVDGSHLHANLALGRAPGGPLRPARADLDSRWVRGRLGRRTCGLDGSSAPVGAAPALPVG